MKDKITDLIVRDIKIANKRRQKVIAKDETNSAILSILSKRFYEEFIDGVDIDSDDFLIEKLGLNNYERIREAEQGLYE